MRFFADCSMHGGVLATSHGTRTLIVIVFMGLYSRDNFMQEQKFPDLRFCAPRFSPVSGDDLDRKWATAPPHLA